MIRLLSNNSMLLLPAAFLLVAITITSCAKGVEPSETEQRNGSAEPAGQSAFVIQLEDGTYIRIEKNFDPAVVKSLLSGAGLDLPALEQMLIEGKAKCNDVSLRDQVLELLQEEEEGE